MPGGATGGINASGEQVIQVQPVGTFAWMVGEVKPSARPLVWLRSSRIVILLPLGTPATYLEMW